MKVLSLHSGWAGGERRRVGKGEEGKRGRGKKERGKGEGGREKD